MPPVIFITPQNQIHNNYKMSFCPQKTALFVKARISFLAAWVGSHRHGSWFSDKLQITWNTWLERPPGSAHCPSRTTGVFKWLFFLFFCVIFVDF